MSVTLKELVSAANALLQPECLNDYCPNGLQVEGRQQIAKIVTGVTASQALIDAALAADADLILVHHGYFWKGENPCITGMKKQRLATLLAADVSLLAYHLPLDVHSEVGNNVQLAQRLDLQIEGGLEVGKSDCIGLYGRLVQPMPASEFAAKIAQVLEREPLHIASDKTQISTVGWCTGAAQGYIEHAIERELDAFISGEISEPTVHSARENNIHYFAAGHHATERYGVQALGAYLSATLGIEHQFIDIDNPV